MNTEQAKGIDHEINFWKEFVKTPRFLEGWVGDAKTPELNPMVADFIVDHRHDDILDCGSGVVSILHGLLSKESSHLIPTDLLANAYELIFDYEKYPSVERVLPFGAEDLPESLTAGFDIVHMSNALDHTQDPVKAYNRLMECVKPGGFLIIQGFENEGLFEKWQGMHQWNLEVKWDKEKADSDLDVFPELVLSNKDGEVTRFKSGISFNADKSVLSTGKNWFIWIVQK